MNYQIQTLNAISPAIYTQLGEHYHVSDSAGQPDAILVRSASMHDMPLAPSVLSIARAGAGTKIILLGDPGQIDNPLLDARTNGLSYASEKMKGSPLCYQVTMTADECERSALATDAVKRM